MQKLRFGLWRDSATLTQQSPTVVTAISSPDYASERGSTESSLNFVIPAAIMRGRIRLKVHVGVPGGTRYIDTTEVTLPVGLHQTLRVRGIPIQYWGPNNSGDPVQLAAPNLVDFQRSASWTLRTWPVSQTPQISLAGVFTWSARLDDAPEPGACSRNWLDLLFWLRIAKAVDGSRPNEIYFGLLPAATSAGPVIGCGGGGGVGAARNLPKGGFLGSPPEGITMAHEMGHVLNFPHAPSIDDSGDPNYPAYEPYDTVTRRVASIGEYGLDINDGTVFPPTRSRDFMSNSAFKWMSLYHHQVLVVTRCYRLPGCPNRETALRRISRRRSAIPSRVLARPGRPNHCTRR